MDAILFFSEYTPLEQTPTKFDGLELCLLNAAHSQHCMSNLGSAFSGRYQQTHPGKIDRAYQIVDSSSLL